MRVPTLSMSAVVIAVGALVGSHAGEAQQVYRLRCNLRGEGLTVWANGFSMRFRGARAGYQARAPMPGECAWGDRGFRDGEPERLQWTVEGRTIFGTLQLDANGTVTQPIYAGGGGDDELDLFNQVMDEWFKRGILNFHVYRDGNVMRVRRVTAVR